MYTSREFEVYLPDNALVIAQCEGPKKAEIGVYPRNHSALAFRIFVPYASLAFAVLSNTTVASFGPFMFSFGGHHGKD